ncbi:TolC family protein [bacterium]|nr:TolC family protein [bacterium]
MRLRIGPLVVAAIAMTAGAAHGAALRRIPLQEAVTIALRRNRGLAAARFDRAAAEAETDVARGAMIPHLDAGENYSATDNPVQVFSDLLLQQDFAASDFALNSLNHPGFFSNFQSDVTLSFPVFAGGRLLAAWRAAGLNAEAARWQEAEARQRVEFDAIRAYYAAVLAERRVAVVDRALAAARAHLAVAQDRYHHGLAVNSDVLRASRGRVDQQRIEAASGVAITRDEFGHVLGAEDQGFAPLENPPELAAAAGVAEPLEALIARAVAARPELHAARTRIAEARQQITIARADYMPTITVASVYENDSKTLMRAGNNAGVFVNARLNLFNGLASRARVDAAAARLNRIEALARDLDEAVRLQVSTAWRRLEAAREGLVVARRDVGYARDALRILDDRYGAGLAPNVAVLDAETAREQADMRLVGSEINVAVDRAAVNLATGSDPYELKEP